MAAEFQFQEGDLYVKFPSLGRWVDSKLDELCFCIATFFNYLAVPRIGFYDVESVLKQTSVYPVITRDMAVYLLEDIYPCASLCHDKDTPPVPDNIKVYIKTKIESHISNKTFIESSNNRGKLLQIEPAVYQVFWKYLRNCATSLIDGVENDGELKQKLNASKDSVLNKRQFSKNYGLNDDIENCALETIIYLTITILDWIEESKVGKEEIETVYKLIVPLDQQAVPTGSKDISYSNIIDKAFFDKYFTITKEAVEMITQMLLDFRVFAEKYKEDGNSKRIINRYMGLGKTI